MPTLLLSPRFSAGSRLLAEAARAAGWAVRRPAAWREIAEQPGPEDPVPYGELLFIQYAADTLGLRIETTPPGWLATLPPEHLRRRVRAVTLAQARRHAGPAFFKSPCDKWLPAAVYPGGDALPAPPPGEADTAPVLIAEPVRFSAEFRCFAADRRVTAASIYLISGSLAQDADGGWPSRPHGLAEAVAFAESVLRDPRTTVPPALVLDVGLIEGRGWAVVESNPPNASGICGCDPAGGADHYFGVSSGTRMLSSGRGVCGPAGSGPPTFVGAGGLSSSSSLVAICVAV
jgi:hypothetical protein